MLIVNPYAFGMRTIKDGDQIVLIIFLSSVLIPMVSVAMSYFLGWIKTFEMMTRQERIAPLLVTIVMYVSMYYYISKANVFPWFFQVCALGVLIGLFLAFFINNFSKISLHAVGMGGLVSMVILMVMYFAYHQVELTLPFIGTMNLTKYGILYGSIILAGIVCSARLLLGAHKIQDIYGGFIVGFFSQLLAFIILQ
jgi:membrane-associated phospholipid phosphatase